MNSSDFFIVLALALIMFGIGASLKFSDFKTMFKGVKSFVTGLTLQMIFLPILALLIATFADIAPELKVGLFIVSICPGGSTSNFISYISGADVALSIALTTVNSFIILVTIPLLSSFAVSHFLESDIVTNISVWDTFTQVLLTLILPAFLGILFNERFPKLSGSIQRPLRVINTLLLGLVYAIKFFAGENSGGSGISMADIQALLPYCLLLHLGAMMLSYFFAKIIRIPNTQATTIGIEVGLQNTALAILVASTLMNNNEMTKPALVFALFSFFTTLAFSFITTRGKSLQTMN